MTLKIARNASFEAECRIAHRRGVVRGFSHIFVRVSIGPVVLFVHLIEAPPASRRLGGVLSEGGLRHDPCRHLQVGHNQLLGGKQGSRSVRAMPADQGGSRPPSLPREFQRTLPALIE